MPFEIVRNDITNMCVDAIVNTANSEPVIGSGTDAMIHEKAGPKLLQARQKLGIIAPGTAKLTSAFQLQAKYVIHTVGTAWTGGDQGEEILLRRCYDASLQLALKHKCRRVAFPLIGAGNYGFPKDKALQIAIAAFSAFLTEHEMQIYLVVFHPKAYKLSENLFHHVVSYIDDHYVEICEKAAIEYDRYSRPSRREVRQKAVLWEGSMSAPGVGQSPANLEHYLKKKDMGFIEALKLLIQKRGLKNATVYKRANMSKQHFSKLMCSPNANPTKPTAIALALALELDLAETKELIGRAGYTLTNSSIFDLIIQYYIEQRNYNIVQINITLYEFDQSLLGS